MLKSSYTPDSVLNAFFVQLGVLVHIVLFLFYDIHFNKEIFLLIGLLAWIVPTSITFIMMWKSKNAFSCKKFISDLLGNIMTTSPAIVCGLWGDKTSIVMAISLVFALIIYTFCKIAWVSSFHLKTTQVVVEQTQETETIDPANLLVTSSSINYV
jgi:hypothetical protein